MFHFAKANHGRTQPLLLLLYINFSDIRDCKHANHKRMKTTTPALTDSASKGGKSCCRHCLMQAIFANLSST